MVIFALFLETRLRNKHGTGNSDKVHRSRIFIERRMTLVCCQSQVLGNQYLNTVVFLLQMWDLTTALEQASKQQQGLYSVLALIGTNQTTLKLSSTQYNPIRFLREAYMGKSENLELKALHSTGLYVFLESVVLASSSSQ